MFGFYGFIKSNLSLPFTPLHFRAYIVKAVQEIATIIRVKKWSQRYVVGHLQHKGEDRDRPQGAADHGRRAAQTS
jgi:hypothetical protein